MYGYGLCKGKHIPKIAEMFRDSSILGDLGDFFRDSTIHSRRPPDLAWCLCDFSHCWIKTFTTHIIADTTRPHVHLGTRFTKKAWYMKRVPSRYHDNGKPTMNEDVVPINKWWFSIVNVSFWWFITLEFHQKFNICPSQRCYMFSLTIRTDFFITSMYGKKKTETRQGGLEGSFQEKLTCIRG